MNSRRSAAPEQTVSAETAIGERRRGAAQPSPHFGTSGFSPAAPKPLGEEAYGVLRRDILSGRLAPEAKLRFRELRERYGLGLAALREALSRLASERLVAFEPLRGYRVARISIEELRDICHLRVQLSVQGLRDAMDRGDADWEAEILASLHRLNRTQLPASPDDFSAIEEWERKHDAFHASLIAACGSPWRMHFCSTLYYQFERYRRFILMGMANSPKTAKRIDKEHAAIAAAAVARDSKEATRLLEAHLGGSLKYFVDHYPAAQS